MGKPTDVRRSNSLEIPPSPTLCTWEREEGESILLIYVIIIGVGSYYNDDDDGVVLTQPLGGHTFHTHGPKLDASKEKMRKYYYYGGDDDDVGSHNPWGVIPFIPAARSWMQANVMMRVEWYYGYFFIRDI